MRLKNVKKGQKFIERDGGQEVLVIALEDAREIEKPGRSGHVCKARVLKGDAPMMDENGNIEFFECHKSGCYGLDLYPVYEDPTAQGAKCTN